VRAKVRMADTSEGRPGKNGDAGPKPGIYAITWQCASLTLAENHEVAVKMGEAVGISR
jgi:hypothetical protein